MPSFEISPEIVWSLHPKLKDDEILSSWITRLAAAYSLSYPMFWRIALEKPPAEADCFPEPDLITILAAKTGTEQATVEDSTLNEWEPTFDLSSDWILSPSFTQYCPICLAENNLPYFRRTWRLAFVTICEQHSQPLLDRCPQCDASVSYQKTLSTHPYDSPYFGLVYCHACSADLRFLPPTQTVMSQELAFQQSLLQVTRRGYHELSPGYRIEASHYFKALRSLIRRLTIGASVSTLQRTLSEIYGLDDHPDLLIPAKPLGRLHHQSRRKIMFLLEKLLEQSPVNEASCFSDPRTRNKFFFQESNYLNSVLKTMVFSE